MASEPTKSWKTIRRQRSLNEARVAVYARLMEAEERIAQARARRGETQAKIDEALDAGALDDATEAEEASDLYLASLARYVEALGGHLEVSAVFAEESILVRRAPEGGGNGQDPAGPSERPRPD